MFSTVYAIWDRVNKERLDGIFLTREACVREIARELREMFPHPEEVEHLDDFEVMISFNEGQYEIEEFTSYIEL